MRHVSFFVFFSLERQLHFFARRQICDCVTRCHADAVRVSFRRSLLLREATFYDLDMRSSSSMIASALACLAPIASALALPKVWQRRQVLAGAAGSVIGAEASWQQAVAAAAVAAEPADGSLPLETIEQFEAGRVVVLKNWLPPDAVRALRADAEAAFQAGHFRADAIERCLRKIFDGI